MSSIIKVNLIEIMTSEYNTETFRALKNNYNRHHGECRTRRLVLEACDRMEAEGQFQELSL